MAEAPDPQQRRLLAVAYSASSTLTGPALLGLLVDWIAGTLPWCTVAGVLIGMAGLFVLLIRFTQSKEPPK
jgi:F0F1-type ATP synthase assembly protein I